MCGTHLNQSNHLNNIKKHKLGREPPRIINAVFGVNWFSGYSDCLYQWIFTKVGVCIDIVDKWFGIADGQILSILTELSAHDTSVFSFLDDNFSKYQWIFTKLGMCSDIVEICSRIANGQISSIFDSYLPAIHPYFTFRTITLVNLNGFSPNLICAFILWRSALWLLIGISSIFDRVICPRHDHGG